MAELDTRIILAGQPVPRPDVRGTVATLGQLRTQGRAQDLLEEKAARETARRAQLRGILAQLGGAAPGAATGAPPVGFGQGDPPVLPAAPPSTQLVPQAPGGTLGGMVTEARPGAPGQAPDASLAARGQQHPSKRAREAQVVRTLQEQGFLEEADKLQEGFLDRDIGILDTQAKALENMAETWQQGGRVLQGVTDEASYQRALPELRRLGDIAQLPVETFPEHFDADVVAQLRSRASDVNEDIANKQNQAKNLTAQLKAESAELAAKTGEAAEGRKERLAERELRVKERTVAVKEAVQGAAPSKRRGVIRGQILREPSFQDFSGARTAFNVLQSGLDLESNFGDLQAITSFARLLDPGSVVRPSEFETVKSVQPLLNRIFAILPRVQEGETLIDDDRKSLRRAANAIIREYERTARSELTPIFGPIAQGAGIPLRELLNIQSPIKDAQSQTVPGVDPAVSQQLQEQIRALRGQ